MKKVFVNFSNHPSEGWPKVQTEAACIGYGANCVVDVPFPEMKADVDESEILSAAEEITEKIAGKNPSAVMVQGEFGLSFSVVEQLKRKGITAVYACSRRMVEETVTETGEYQKKVKFQFVRFREYR